MIRSGNFGRRPSIGAGFVLDGFLIGRRRLVEQPALPLGAGVVIILAMLAKTKNYYIAGLVPLFPTFALIAHYIVGKGRSVDDLKTTSVFGMWSIIPYFVYLAALYVLVDRMRLEASLALAAVAWLMAATVLVSVWVRLH